MVSNRVLVAACIVLALWTSTVSAQVERGFFASVNSLPLGTRFAAFASVGVIGWNTSADVIVTLPGGRAVDDLDDSGEDLIYGAGLQWHVSDRWSLQVSYEHVDLDIESGKVGATFRL